MLRKIWIVLGAVALISIAYVTAFAVEEVQQPVVGDGAAGGAAEPITWTVCSSGCDFTSIQAAVDVASAGDTIELGAETFFEVISVRSTPNLLIRGQSPARTIIDGGGFDGAVIELWLPTTLKGLAVRNGSTAVKIGGLGVNSQLDECIIDATGGDFGVWVPLYSSHGGPIHVKSSTIIGGRVGIVSGYGGVVVNSSTITSSYLALVQIVDCMDPQEPCQGGCDPGPSDGTIASFRNRPPQEPDQGVTVIDSTIAFNDFGLGAASWCHDEGGTLCSVIDGDPYCSPPMLPAVGSTIVFSVRSDCLNSVYSLGFNSWASEYCSFEPSDLTGIDPQLLSLADNGGPTPTHALAPGSPAIDAGGNDCLATDQRGVARPQDGDGDGVANCDIGAYEVDVQVVNIIIKPDGYPNSVNPHSRGVIPVAILGSDTFDVADVDVTTLAFGPGGAPIAHLNGHPQDVNYDGYMDLVTHYRSRDTGIACGDESAMLTGELLDRQPIEGTDSIQTVGCRETRWPAIWMKDQDRPDTDRRAGPVNIDRK